MKDHGRKAGVVENQATINTQERHNSKIESGRR
jgi:hypothetical protein